VTGDQARTPGEQFFRGAVEQRQSGATAEELHRSLFRSAELDDQRAADDDEPGE